MEATKRDQVSTKSPSILTVGQREVARAVAVQERAALRVGVRPREGAVQARLVEDQPKRGHAAPCRFSQRVLHKTRDATNRSLTGPQRQLPGSPQRPQSRAAVPPRCCR